MRASKPFDGARGMGNKLYVPPYNWLVLTMLSPTESSLNSIGNRGPCLEATARAPIRLQWRLSVAQAHW